MTLYTKRGTRYVPTTLSEQGAWGWEDLMGIAAPPTAQAEGWRLVPVEPTTDQEWAGKQAVLRGLTMAAACKIYKAMLAAAPLPPTSAEGVEHAGADQS